MRDADLVPSAPHSGIRFGSPRSWQRLVPSAAAFAFCILFLWTAASARGGEQLRPPLDTVLPRHFSWGVSAYGNTGRWPEQMKADRGVNWGYLYRYYLWQSPEKHWTRPYLDDLLHRAERLGAVPVLTYYQMLDRGKHKGYKGEEWDIVIRAVQDPEVMKGYFEDVKMLLEGCAAFGKPVIFQSEPDSWAFCMLFHTGQTNDATKGAAAVASSGHPDAAGFPNNLAGVAQTLIHLRDKYALRNVYMGICAFNFRAGQNPQHTVTYLKSMNASWDLLFEKSVDDIAAANEKTYLNWMKTVSTEMGLRYLEWQTYGRNTPALLPDYPGKENVTKLIQAGCIGNLVEVGTPKPEDDDMATRLAAYYRKPLPIPGFAAAEAKAAASALPAVPVAPAHSPAPAAAQVDKKVLEEWQARLIARLAAALKNGTPVQAFLRLLGPQSAEEKCAVAAVDEKTLTVRVQGNVLPVPWKDLAARDRANLARTLVNEDDAESLLLAAVFLMASGREDEAEDCFAKAAAKDAARAKEVRASLTPAR